MFENISNVLDASKTVFHRPGLREHLELPDVRECSRKFLRRLRKFLRRSSMDALPARAVQGGRRSQGSSCHTFIEFRLQLCIPFILQSRHHEGQQDCRVLDSP
jgi:hypothetical protein